MLFGSISYLNLLPFQLFLKRYIKNSGAQMSFRYKRGTPSKINSDFKKRKVNAAFVSSITTKKSQCTNLGIIAHKKVYSVLLLKGEAQDDPASQSSNQLTKVLGLEGKVLIGDVALKYYLDGGEAIDLANEWHKKTGLPFVFARLCYHKYGQTIQKLANNFSSKKVYIPQYILKKESKKRGITEKQLTWYLKHIHYNMDYKADKSLKIFLRS